MPPVQQLEQGRPLVPSATLGMVLFLVTEAMFFTALISAFLVLRAEAPAWPPPGQPRLPLGVTAVNTLVLLGSGWSLQRALGPGRAIRSSARWLAVTAVLGTLFLVVQGSEWLRLVGFGLTTSSSLYGATFYALVGAHALHVLAALGVLLWATLRRPRLDSEVLEPVRLYWLFVVAVWPILYVLVYFA